MKTPQRVVWSEGMFMSPQHMQQLDLYHEQLLGQRLGALSPHAWGAVSLEISQSALAAGQLRIDRFVGILPDGLAVAFEHGDPLAPPARPVEAHFPATERTLDVYLAVPRERARAANCAEGGTGSAPAPRTRFVSVERSVVDGVKADSEVPVAFARPNVQVLFGNEQRDDFEAIKIAEVTRDASGALVICDPYIPPCLRISASPFLVAGVRRVLTLAAAQRRDLASKRREPAPGRVEFSASDVGLYLQLHVLSGAIPVLQHMIDSADASAREAYLLLAQLAGQLTSFSPDADPAALPKLNYTDLRSTFEPLLARLVSLLHATVRFNTVLVDPSIDRVDLSFEVIDGLVSYRHRWFRVYGGGGYVFRRDPDFARGLLQGGLELYGPTVSLTDDRSLWLEPVLGANVSAMEERDWEATTTIKAGGGLANGHRYRPRLLVVYLTGLMPFGQFFITEEAWSLGGELQFEF